MPDLPSTADIRQFLFEFFNDDELTSLCFDYFPEVHDDFTIGMTKQQKTRMLLAYCQHREVVINLLGALQRARPEPYAKRFQVSRVETRAVPIRPVRDPRQVFISHAHEDAEFAHQLANDLRRNGWRVWIAPDSIQPGEMWVDEIQRGLDESGVFVVAMTPEALQSRWVKSETNAAIALEHRRQIRFIPLDVKVCDVPSLWTAYQRTSFCGSYANGLAALLEELEPERRAQHEREAQEQAARGKAELLEREMETHRQAQQAKMERVARRTAERAKAGQRPVGALVGLALVTALTLVAVGVWTWPNIHLMLSPPPTPIATRISETDHMVMVYVPAGLFLMGSSDDDKQAKSNEKPAQTVNLDAFWIDRTEVTNAQYKQCVQAQKCKASSYADDSIFNGDNQPVVGVDWNDAQAYCEWAGRQLPTEAQWEKAARGTDGRIYPWGNQTATCEYAVMNDSSRIWCVKNNAAWAVGSKPNGASPYGAFDMAGNVTEWVADWYDTYPSGAPRGIPTNPVGPATGDYKVLRGGSWQNDAREVGAARRYSGYLGGRHYTLGFRCASGGPEK